MSDFDKSKFLAFCGALKIDTKEYGRIRLGDRLMGTQSWVLDAVDVGIQENIRNFVILKCRQAGISTLFLGLDLYWMFKHAGLTGSLVVHDDKARNGFRQTLQLYYDGLPHEWRRQMTKHNRDMFSFENRSRLNYLVAGTTERPGSGALGRSVANTYIHATEMSSWADAEGANSLRDTMAEHNPARLYVWESTARGFNLFYDMWEDAKKSVTQREIFVSFWANHFYRAARGGEIWNAYWGKKGRMTAEERGWVRDVKLLYDVTVDDEVLAWYRYKLLENGGDENLLMQEHPPTEHHAFIATGSQFFGARAISDAIKRTRRQEPPECYRIECKEEFWQTQIVGAPERMATLRIWERPAQVKCQYVLGCDPRYGSENTHDTNSVSVWRAYGDKVVQVAEWCDPDMSTYAVAWVMCLLAGFYDPCLVNLEINGPGQAVYDEVLKLRKRANLGLSGTDKKIFNVVRNMQNHLYKRVDQISGVPSALHTKTTYESKDRYMNNFRDHFERGKAVPVSPFLVGEMKGIVREEGKAPAAGSRTTDDRVVAGALAVHSWSEHLQIKLMILGMTYERAQQQTENVNKISSAGERMVAQYLKKMGVAP